MVYNIHAHAHTDTHHTPTLTTYTALSDMHTHAHAHTVQERDRKSTVIKLAENHVAIDFLILDDDGTKAHNVLYFVQVSTRKYQDRLASNRLGAIKEKGTHTASKTPLNFYATELEVDESRCYFVYASPLASTSYIHIHLLLCIYSMRKNNFPFPFR